MNTTIENKLKFSIRIIFQLIFIENSQVDFLHYALKLKKELFSILKGLNQLLDFNCIIKFHVISLSCILEKAKHLTSQGDINNEK